MKLLQTFICESCNEYFEAHPAQNCWCSKCGTGHSLCEACRAIHLLTARQESHYLEMLEEIL